MNIFGIGLPELILIFMIMLIVAGPQRMIRWAYVLGVYIGKARNMWAEVVQLLQREFDDAGVDVTLPKELPTRQTINTWVQDATRPYTSPIEETLRQTSQTIKADVTLNKTNASPHAKPSSMPTTQNTTAPQSQSPSAKSFGTWGKATPTKPKPDVERFGTWGIANDQSQIDNPNNDDTAGQAR